MKIPMHCIDCHASTKDLLACRKCGSRKGFVVRLREEHHEQSRDVHRQVSERFE
jgi:hypothetical protein